MERSEPQPEADLQPGIGLRSATALVVATMIGVGIFTSTGFQAEALPHPGFIVLLWVVGGGLAFCGALCYAELGAAIPEAGAEYVYIRESFGYTAAFMSAVVSFVAGFAAPIAAVLKSLVIYLAHFIPVLERNPELGGFLPAGDALAILLVWALILIHLRGLRHGLGFNDLVTGVKVLGIILLLLAALAIGHGHPENLTTVAPSFHTMTLHDRMGAFATSLIFVMFCYSGYNAASYMASEVCEPQRVLPRAILGGTALVMVLYLGLNMFYLYGADVNELAGNVEVGLLAARNLFGPIGTGAVTAILLLTMLSAASAMTVAGPRVSYAMGRDFPAFRIIAEVSPTRHVPTVALLAQGILTSAIILTGSVDQIQQYVGIALTVFSSLAVASVLVLRWRKPTLARPFKTWGYPFTPILFLVISLWTLVWNVQRRPLESLLVLVTVLLAGLLGRWTKQATQG